MGTHAQDADIRRASRFFWSTLAAATAASVAGNIAHAVLAATAGSTAVAAWAAVVAPVALLAATHGVAVLVRTRTLGVAYWSALTMTAAIAVVAFVLSFYALRSLAVTWAGFPPSTAWLWPLAIDLSIAQSTLALLALTRPRAAAAEPGAPSDIPVKRFSAGVTSPAPPAEASEEVLEDWYAEAESLIDAGVTRLDRDKLAVMLAELADGASPNAIARKIGVGYNTVARIRDRVAA